LSPAITAPQGGFFRTLLKDLNAGMPNWISYQARDDEGTQSPLETLDRGWGS